MQALVSIVYKSPISLPLCPEPFTKRGGTRARVHVTKGSLVHVTRGDGAPLHSPPATSQKRFCLPPTYVNGTQVR